MAKLKGYDLDTSAHAVFSLYYHIIFVTKYRRKAMHSEAIRERLKQIMFRKSSGPTPALMLPPTYLKGAIGALLFI
jgi:hypothetical protein